jgi:pimeloyl-ACP methyl ester carboxylesterase
MPTAEINGQGIYYEDSGGDKPVVFFMHGFLFDHTMFDPQVAYLKDEYRCVRFDARALGQTRWDGEPFTLNDTVSDAIGLLDYLGIERAAFVGMSQGGYALVRLAVRHPERVTAAVFLSTYNGVDTDDVKEVYRSMRDGYATDAKDGVIGTFAHLFLGADQALRDYWVPRWQATSAVNVFHGMNALIDREDIPASDLAKITQPSYVMHGNDDQGIPSIMAENTLYKVLPNVKGMFIIPGGTHAANLVNPDATNPALKAFLDAHAR